MKVESIENIKPQKNWILIKPDFAGGITRPYEVKNPDGTTALKIDIDTTFECEKHACCTGVVVAQPESLYYNPEDRNYSLEWITDIETKIGDKVIFGYFAYTEAFRESDPRWIKCNGEIYILVFYGLMYLAQRGEEVIMLNGYTLVEPVEDEVDTNLFLPSYLKRSVNKQRGIVRYMGSLNREYSNHRYPPDDDSLQVGDLVTMDRYCNIPLEYDLWRTFGDKNVKLWRVQRTFINGIIKQVEDGKEK